MRYVLGHASRQLERGGDVATEPFARYLEQAIANLDLLAAVAREHGMRRRDVVAILKRDELTVGRELVRRALWCYGQNGHAVPRRPDATSFFDLYPDDKRARTCPGCGGGKAPHAELCRACRRKAGSSQRRGPRRIREPLIEFAYRLYVDEQLTVEQCAERIIDRTPHGSVPSLAHALGNAWRERGWPVRAGSVTRRIQRQRAYALNGDGRDDA